MLIDRLSLYLMSALATMILLLSLHPPHVSNLSQATVATANRVMIFVPMLWHYLLVDGTDQNILAIAKYMKEEAKGTFLGKLYPCVASKNEALTSIGAVPLGVEQIMFLHPDRVLSWVQFSNALKEIKYPGLVEINANDFEDKAKLFKTVGEITGKGRKVQWLLQRSAKEIDIIEKTMPKNTKSTSLVVLGNTDNFFLWGSKFKNFNKNVKRIHGVNSAVKIKSYSGSINIETLIGLDPDVIFLASYFKKPITLDEVYDNPKLSSLSAVKNRRVYIMPTGASRMEGPVEAPILLEWMAVLLHPEIVSNFHPRQTIRQTYKEIYGFEISDDEIDKMLHIDENQISANYKIFKNNDQ